jgi:hypothetical protein
MSTASSSEPGLTESQAAAFFLSPEEPLHGRYEALRAYFVEQLTSTETARRFRYSPGSFRVLCHQFRHDPEKRSAFFRSLPRAYAAPARDPVRELVVALRKRNLSVYDIQRELAAGDPLDRAERSLHAPGTVRIPDRMRYELKAEALSKGGHLRHRHHVATAATQHHHVRVIDHDAGCGATYATQRTLHFLTGRKIILTRRRRRRISDSVPPAERRQCLIRHLSACGDQILIVC